jgi:hypothetical protein
MVPHRVLIFIAALMASAVPARAQGIKPRSIEPGRIIAAGDFPAVTLKPRSIEPGRIIAAGEFPAAPVNPAVKPRTIPVTGWTASPPPKGGKK